MTVTVTFFADFGATSKRQQTLELHDLARLVEQTSAPSKSALPWFKLARFGNATSPTGSGSLRFDKNVICITGCEGDYDCESIAFEEAVEVVEKAGLAAIVYTSPSHTPAKPRWRVLAPTSRELPPRERKRLVARLNGLFRGELGPESFTLSQAYYYGSVDHNPDHRVVVVDGVPIDLLCDLDAIAIGKPAAPALRLVAGLSHDAEMICQIITGDSLHVPLCALAARYIGRGLDSHSVAELLRGLMLAKPDVQHDERWRDRYDSIPSLVASAAQKYVAEAEHRRAIARVVHDLVRRRRPGEEIKSAVLTEAARRNFGAERALAIGDRILADVVKQWRHA